MSITNIDTSIGNLRDRLEAIKTAGEYHKLTPILSQISRVIDSRRDKTDVTLYLFEKLDQLLLHYKSIIIEWLTDQFEHSIYGGLEGLDILKNNIGLNWPELDNWVNNHKQTFVKQLIFGMKLNDFNSVITDIEELRQLNVSWPELDIFEKPAREEQRRRDRDEDEDEDDYIDDHDLYENDVMSIKIEKIINELLHTGYVDVSVRRLEDQGLHDSKIVEVLSPYATQIVDKITENPRMPSYTIYEMILLLQLGARWPVLINAIVKHKHAVVKYLLNDFKENGADDIDLDSLYLDIERLKSLGIAWPDLNVILDSVITELKRRGLYDDPTPLAEAQPVIPPKIVKQFEREYSNIHLRGVGAIWETIVHLKEIGANNQQIAALMSERREQVAQTIRNSLHNVSPKSFNTINEAMYAIYELLSVGIKWPLLLQLLDRYEDKVTAWAISCATHLGHFGSIVADRLVAFEKLGFDTADIRQELKNNVSPNVLQFLYRQGFGWQAQNKIQTLAKLNLLPIEFSDREVDDILSVFMDYVANYGMTNAVYGRLVELIPNDIAKIKQTFEKNKAAIVKSMLKNIKSQYAPSIVDTLHILHKLNIKWPEMRIITTSMKAGR